MIEPVRTGYIGENQKLTPSVTLPTPVQLFPSTTMQASTIPRAGGEIPCVIITPPASPLPHRSWSTIPAVAGVWTKPRIVNSSCARSAPSPA